MIHEKYSCHLRFINSSTSAYPLPPFFPNAINGKCSVIVKYFCLRQIEYSFAVSLHGVELDHAHKLKFNQNLIQEPP